MRGLGWPGEKDDITPNGGDAKQAGDCPSDAPVFTVPIHWHDRLEIHSAHGKSKA